MKFILEPTKRRTEFTFNTTTAQTEVVNIATQEFEDIKFALDSVFFFEQRANETVNTIASYLLKNKYSTVPLTGHTDSVGPAEYNMMLSKKRAESIKSLLIKKGIAPSRIETLGKGETQLLNDCGLVKRSTPEQHRVNRSIS